MTVGNDAYIYDLNTGLEVNSIESMDVFMAPDNFLSTGFRLEYSFQDEEREDKIIERKYMITNEYQNLAIEKFQTWAPDETGKKYALQNQNVFAKILNSFSEIDLHELLNIVKAITQSKRIPDIDKQTILCNFQGHTIFSIFFDHIKVYEAITDQYEDEEFEDEEDIYGNDCENS